MEQQALHPPASCLVWTQRSHYVTSRDVLTWHRILYRAWLESVRLIGPAVVVQHLALDRFPRSTAYHAARGSWLTFQMDSIIQYGFSNRTRLAKLRKPLSCIARHKSTAAPRRGRTTIYTVSTTDKAQFICASTFDPYICKVIEHRFRGIFAEHGEAAGLSQVASRIQESIQPMRGDLFWRLHMVLHARCHMSQTCRRSGFAAWPSPHRWMISGEKLETWPELGSERRMLRCFAVGLSPRDLEVSRLCRRVVSATSSGRLFSSLAQTWIIPVRAILNIFKL
jgi:hypothetical protein